MYKRINLIKLWPLIIFTIALAVRFIFLSQFQNNPFFQTDVKGVDPSLYHEWAKELSQGFWPGYKLLYGHPFYPYVVSFFYRFWAVDSYSVIVMQFIMGSLSCVLLYFIAKKIFSQPVAIISSCIAALYSPFIFYEGLMVPSALAIFLNLGALLMLLNILEGLNTRRTFLAGLLLGCSLITNSGIAPFIVFSIFWAAFVLKNTKKTAFKHVACILIGVMLPLIFMSFKHFSAEGNFDSFGAHGGINFYVGNNPKANGTFIAPLGFTPSAEGLSEDSAKYAQMKSGARLTAGGVSKFWYDEALLYIKLHPAQWLKLEMRKLILFWNNIELSDVADFYFVKNGSPIFRFNPLCFSAIAALGFLGMILAFRDLRKTFLLYAGTASFMISCLLFFVNSRYRLSAVPYLVIFSGFAVWSVFQKLRLNDFKRLFVYSVVTVFFFILSNTKITSADTCTPMYNLAVIYEKRGLYDKAIEISDKLLKENWNIPAVHFNLGVCFYQKGSPDKAIAEFKEVLRFNPVDRDSHFNLGMIYYQKNDYNTAFNEFNSSLRGSDEDMAAYYWIGEIYRQKGDFNKAIEAYKEALKLNPEAAQVIKALNGVKNLQKRKK